MRKEEEEEEDEGEGGGQISISVYNYNKNEKEKAAEENDELEEVRGRRREISVLADTQSKNDVRQDATAEEE